VAFEPDAIALARAIVASDAKAPEMVIDMGTQATDLVIVASGGPKLIRSIAIGSDGIIKSAVQNLNIDESRPNSLLINSVKPRQVRGANI